MAFFMGGILWDLKLGFYGNHTIIISLHQFRAIGESTKCQSNQTSAKK